LSDAWEEHGVRNRRILLTLILVKCQSNETKPAVVMSVGGKLTE